MHSTTCATFVIGPDGERMTRADLPAANTSRWVPRRKARVVAAVEGGLITEDEAFERYGITEEEYECWKAAISQFGMKGLRVTKIRRQRTTSE